MPTTKRHRLTAVIGLSLFAVALWVLHRALGRYHFGEVVQELHQIPAIWVALAVGFTALNYMVLTTYDVLAIRYLGRSLPYPRIALGSFVGYAFSHNLGLAALGAGAARYRIYSAWGVSAVETAKIVLFCGFTFWLGFCVLGGAVLLFHSDAILPHFHVRASVAKGLAVVLLAIVAAYVLLAAFRKRSFVVHGWELAAPTVRMSWVQVGLSCVDWLLAAAVLWCLLPAGSGVSFVELLAVFLLAVTAGFVSHVPGGLGVLEGVALACLSPTVPAPKLIGALLLYRVVYYLIPLLVAVLMLGIHEMLSHRPSIGRRVMAIGGRSAFVVGSSGTAAVPAGQCEAALAGSVVLPNTVLSIPSRNEDHEWIGESV